MVWKCQGKRKLEECLLVFGIFKTENFSSILVREDWVFDRYIHNLGRGERDTYTHTVLHREHKHRCVQRGMVGGGHHSTRKMKGIERKAIREPDRGDTHTHSVVH